MSIGIRTAYVIENALSIASSVGLTTTGLTSPIAAGQTQVITARIPITVGATGGVRLQVVVPAGGVLFDVSIKLFNTVAPSLTAAIQLASAAFTNALANAGNHFIEITGTVVNGLTAGNVDIQIAQSTSDVLPLDVLQGGSLEVVSL